MTPRPQTERILAVLADNEWHSFEEIRAAVGVPFSMLERRGELRREGKQIERRGEWYRLLPEREGIDGSAPRAARGVESGSSRSENSQPLSPRPVASSPPPSARRASPFLCVIDESGGQDPDFWTQNSEWSVKA